MGGLGNQLFQIATALAYSMQYNISCVFPYDTILGKEGIPRPTYWDTLLYKLKKNTTIEPSNMLTNEMLYKMPIYNEPCFQYLSIQCYNNFMIHGYFQSYLYFEKYKKEIFTDFIEIPLQQQKIIQEYPQYLESHSNHRLISMHFRLGDYKDKPDYHPILSYEYYEKSLSMIKEHIPLNDLNQYKILYFCEKEDNAHVQRIIFRLTHHFQLNENVFIKVDDEIEDWKQLLIMSCCHIHIIANSTFSWWAAYLNSYSDKVVLYPSVWFGHRIHSILNDLFPKEWIKITV